MSTLKKAYQLLTPLERKRGLWVLGLVIGMALLETAGIASVMPFLAVLGNPTIIETNATLKSVYVSSQSLGIRSAYDFLIALGAGTFLLIITISLYRTFTFYAMSRYIQMRRYSLGARLLETYLRQPYEFFLGRHSGEMGKTILSEVDHVIANVFVPVYNMVAYGLVLCAITTLLVFVNPWLALAAAGLLSGVYFVIHHVLKQRLTRLGSALVATDKRRYMTINEALGGIKAIKLLGCEQIYLGKFQDASKQFATIHTSNQILIQMPKYLIEAFAFGGIVAMIITLMIAGGGYTNNVLGEVLPVIGLYTFSAYRLQPAVQAIFQGFSCLRFGKAAVDNLYNDLYSNDSLDILALERPEKLKGKDSIILENLTYRYPSAEKDSLYDLNIEIPIGSSVGLVGSTGAGKTTLVDIILGLLQPTSGAIAVDGIPVTESRLRAWQQSLGYVPQEIFFTDASIAENIALGVRPDEIDYDQVVRCAQLAQAHDFILSELPNQYATVVGERGIRLSGGQRQRIGIARALYRDPEVLIFDEATSALDTVTEQALIEAIEELSQQKTVILIAHRLSTVKSCDLIVFLEHGQIKAMGKFEELIKASEQFNKMVSIGQK